MLDRSNLNKILLILLALFCLSCCAEDRKKKAPGVFHTELVCPNFDVILIRYTTIEEVKRAIQQAYENKKKFRTSETYTVISLDGNRSMKIDKLLPEDAINCNLREIYHPRVDKNKKQYLESPGYKFFTGH